MVYAVCWALIGISVVLMALHYINHLDQRAIDKADRAYHAALDAANALGTQQDAQRHAPNRPDMGDWSRRHANVPEIAKSEGVQHERRHH